ncbi:MAG: ribokinase [Bacteroidota bacterium]
MAHNILVIGSSNTDMVVQSPHLPVPGETILGSNFIMNPGGKGANQAVAAAKLGGKVSFLAKIGKDIFGNAAIDNFNQYGINVEGVIVDPDYPSGVALIMVDEQGENCISVALGANEQLQEADILSHVTLIENCDYLLTQLETPLSSVQKAIELASTKNKKVVLNPAPAQALPDELFPKIDIITPNETEAALLTGAKVDDMDGVKAAAVNLREKGVETVIITIGSKGAYVLSAEFEGVVAPPKVKAVDTTAAGDTFNGALVVALADGASLVEAVKFANQAAAFSVTKLGAQASAPARSDLDTIGS